MTKILLQEMGNGLIDILVEILTCTQKIIDGAVCRNQFQQIEISQVVLSQHERCTRRYTAGYCFEPVKPVWTFMFQHQDCVVRLGCPPSPRANRFISHTRCIKRCKLLLDIYSQLLMGGSNHTGHLRSRLWASDTHRRGSEQDNDAKDSPGSYDDKEYDLMAPDSYLPSQFENPHESPEEVTVNIDEDVESHHMLDVLNGN